MTRIVCIGECMVELRAGEAGSETFERSYAGDAFNTAVYLKRSLPQARVQFLTATGNDVISASMRLAWERHDIDAALAFTVNGATPGLYLIETDAAGERRFHYWRRDSAARQWLERLLAQGESILWGADLVYLSGISLAILEPKLRIEAIALLGRLKGHVGRCAFDPNYRASLWESQAAAASTVEAVIGSVDIVLPSTDDVRLLFDVQSPETQLDLLEARGAAEIALTLGSEGCVVSADSHRTRLAAVGAPQVVDTSGAGDSFNGAYLAMRLQGASAPRAAEFGMAVASRVVSHRGAILPASLTCP